MPRLSAAQAEELPAPIGRDSRHTSLGVQLMSAGLATDEQIDFALAEQRRTGKRLGEILVAHDVLFEEDLARTLAEISGMPYQDLNLDPPDPAVSIPFPRRFCRRRGVLPVRFDDGSHRRHHRPA